MQTKVALHGTLVAAIASAVVTVITVVSFVIFVVFTRHHCQHRFCHSCCCQRVDCYVPAAAIAGVLAAAVAALVAVDGGMGVLGVGGNICTCHLQGIVVACWYPYQHPGIPIEGFVHQC